MEHDERDETVDSFEEVLESLTADQGNFEEFLARKADECVSKTDIISELRLTPIAKSENAADIAAVNSSNGASGETSAMTHTDSSPNVPGVANALETKLTLHNHPIVGSYVTETSEPITYDEELRSVYFESINVTINEMTAEQVIERQHKLERAVQMIRMQQQGMRVGLEELLKARSWKDREAIMELDRKERAKSNKRVAAKSEAAKTKTASSIGKAKTKAMKTVDTFISLAMDRAAITTQLKTLSLHDSVVEAYMDKKFGKESK